LLYCQGIERHLGGIEVMVNMDFSSPGVPKDHNVWEKCGRQIRRLLYSVVEACQFFADAYSKENGKFS
jgi:hypothetical protein